MEDELFDPRDAKILALKNQLESMEKRAIIAELKLQNLKKILED